MGRCEFKKNASPDGISTEVCKKEGKKEKPGGGYLRRQFCSDHPISQPGSAFSRSSPGRPRPRDGCTPGRGSFCKVSVGNPLPSSPQNSRPSPRACPPGGSSAQRNESAGRAPGASSSQHHHLPPTADLRLHAMDHRPGRAGCGMQGVQGQPCSPSGEIPAAGRIVEPRGQAWPSGTRGHPIHRGPGPSNTHHTEP